MVTIDLGAEQDVDALRMTIGAHVSDFPGLLVIETSNDRREWTTQWKGAPLSRRSPAPCGILATYR